jgi:uncharacterized membrane protein
MILMLPLALLANGIAAGVLLGGELGVVPYFKSLPVDRYIHAHTFVTGRYDPFQPICMLITVILDITIAVTTAQPAVRLLCVAAVLAILCVIGVARTRTARMARWLKKVDPAALPADFDPVAFRTSWSTWNRRRVGLGVAAFACNVAAVGVLL